MGDVLNAWSDSCLLLSLHPSSKRISLQRRKVSLGKKQRGAGLGEAGQREKDNTRWMQDLKNAGAQNNGSKTDLQLSFQWSLNA